MDRCKKEALEMTYILKTGVVMKDINKIAELLASQNAEIRAEGVSMLGHLKATSYSQKIASLLKDRSDLVRASAAQALGKLNATEYMDELVRLLNDPSPRAQESAVMALCSLHLNK